MYTSKSPSRDISVVTLFFSRSSTEKYWKLQIVWVHWHLFSDPCPYQKSCAKGHGFSKQFFPWTCRCPPAWKGQDLDANLNAKLQKRCPRLNFQMVLESMHRLCSTYLVSLLHDIEPKPAKTKSSFLCLQLCNAGVCCNLRSFKSCQRSLPISRADVEWSEWCMPFPQHRADSTGVSNICEPICAPCPSSNHGVPTTSNRKCSQMFPNVASVSEWTTKNAEELCPRTQSCKQLPTESTSKWNSHYTFLWLHKKTSSQTSLSWLVT